MNLPKSRSATKSVSDAPDTIRRGLLVAGGLLAPYTLINLFSSFPAPTTNKWKEEAREDYEGDAVTSPQLETSIIELAEAGATPKDGARYASAKRIVDLLEEQGGPQLFASRAPGKWCIPWVGGWERVWTTDPAERFPGGPKGTGFALSTTASGEPMQRSGSSLFSMTSARQFIYGPGEGGFVVEYLHSAPGVPDDLLLTQLGDIKNLGGNFFELNFKDQLRAFAAKKDDFGTEVLARPTPLEGTMDFGPRAESATLQTTYLSATMWILRDEAGRKAVFSRTETKSVSDRRGLVVNGQVKEHPDEETRYGKLLFGETQQEYQGWEESVDAQAPSSRIKGLLQ